MLRQNRLTIFKDAYRSNSPTTKSTVPILTTRSANNALHEYKLNADVLGALAEPIDWRKRWPDHSNCNEPNNPFGEIIIKLHN